MNYNATNDFEETSNTQEKYTKKTPMELLEEKFKNTKSQPEWLKLTPAQRMDAEFTHKMELKWQKNREIYEEITGEYFPDEEIPDEELDYIRNEYAQVSAKLDVEFDRIFANQVEQPKKPRKKRTSKKTNDNHFLFS